MKNKLSQDYLKECLYYNPETGVFTWNNRPISHFKNQMYQDIWNLKYSNTESGYTNVAGYLSICINYKRYLAHRLAFLYVEGYIPENGIDHIDRNRLNNKWSNLREVSQSCNLQNCNLRKNNTSGINGVSWHKNKNKWVSYIVINYETKHIGIFDNFNDAVMARYQEEINNPLWTCSGDSSAMKYLKENSLI